MDQHRSPLARVGRSTTPRMAVVVAVLMMVGSHSWAAPPDPELARVEAQIALDVLERFCTPYSDIGSLFAEGTTGKARTTLSVRPLLEMLGVPEEDAASMALTLKTGGIEEFEIVWEPVVTKGFGKERFLRKCRLTCRAVAPAKDQEHHVAYFRVWVMRGGP